MSKIENLSVDIIKTNAGTQMRAKVDQDVVDTYAELWRAKHEFPPLDVFFDGESHVLGDGFHRLYGAKDAKRASVPCRIHKGGLREAILFACGANHEHGLHRSRQDKRLAVTTLLDDEEWSKRSQTWIAEQCRVSKSFVMTINAERRPPQPTPPNGQEVEKPPSRNGGRDRITGRDGKQYPVARPAEESKPQVESISKDKAEVPAAGPCFKGGEHELDEDRICMKCHESDPVLHAKIAEQNRAIESFARSVMAAIDSAPADPWLDDSRLGIARDQIKSACSTIRLAKAHDKPCPKCNGAGCKTCRNCGYLPKTSYEAAGGQ